MAKSPKLKIKNYIKRPLEEKICNLKEGEDILQVYLPKNYKTGDIAAALIAVEGQRIHSYDELIKIVNQDFYKDREFIEVMIHAAFGGG